jgi:hypothetical protein
MFETALGSNEHILTKIAVAFMSGNAGSVALRQKNEFLKTGRR